MSPRSAAAGTLEREFDVTAYRYDLMVGLNPGYHEHLRTAAEVLATHLPEAGPQRLLDPGCGSGAWTVVFDVLRPGGRLVTQEYSVAGSRRAAGFEDIQVTTVDGWRRGILHTFSARHPETR